MTPGLCGLPSRAASVGHRIRTRQCRWFRAGRGALARARAQQDASMRRIPPLSFPAQGAIGVNGMRRPAVNALVAPGSTPRNDQQVAAAGIVQCVLVGKAQSTVHAAGFEPCTPPVTSTTGKFSRRVSTAQGEQRIVIRRVINAPKLLTSKVPTQALDHA